MKAMSEAVSSCDIVDLAVSIVVFGVASFWRLSSKRKNKDTDKTHNTKIESFRRKSNDIFSVIN